VRQRAVGDDGSLCRYFGEDEGRRVLAVAHSLCRPVSRTRPLLVMGGCNGPMQPPLSPTAVDQQGDCGPHPAPDTRRLGPRTRSLGSGPGEAQRQENQVLWRVSQTAYVAISPLLTVLPRYGSLFLWRSLDAAPLLQRRIGHSVMVVRWEGRAINVTGPKSC